MPMVRCSPGYGLPLRPSGNAHYCGSYTGPAGDFRGSSCLIADGKLLMVGVEFTQHRDDR
jgi:hypothetical protein